ncbi:transcription termination factor 5, mitochondrial [Chrysoperla carnea]|uniref:transcription termination factor 5, mitochondrial n=1 Tax=Chrysoperla carnea TaxID=189513 RepID=UPI001D06EAD0|nr:transcription termination factor 5, mitochondrial [Chrysoperla carnea]
MDKKLKKTLIELLDIAPLKLVGILKKYPSLKRVDIENVKLAHSTLINFGIDQDQITEIPQLIALLPVVIENRCLLLQEFGFNKITAQLLLRYLVTVKKRVSLLKSHGLLPADANVPENIYSYIEKPPKTAPMLPILDEKKSLYEVYMSVREHYLTWRLEFPNRDSYLSILNTYCRLKHKSFRSVEETIKILENDLGFTKERIRNHGYLLHSNPHNTRSILSEITEIGGMPIHEVLKKYPKVIMTNVKTIKEIIQILKDNNIPNESIQQSYTIFTMASRSILNRLHQLKEIPEFNVLSKNKRILKLVNHQHKAKQRLEYLHKIKMRNASLHILSSTDADFEKYVISGADKTRGMDVINYLKDKLKDKSNDIRSELMKHPFWFHVPLVQVSETCEYLCKNYNVQDIKEVAQILLYPKEKVKTEILNIRNVPEIKRKWLSPVQELNLCLYYLEKPHHFSGDGIWKNETIS